MQDLTPNAVVCGVLGVYNQHQYDAERVEWLRKLSDYLESLAAVPTE